ncbi:WD-repeat protein [Reticulomyxa filosa]|uniref:WD-repeat protein n=1 Tax=Reticulomyxa filosa TaxID=46433 RepID=X6N2V2_RETFI|nr:WD-repeat protein [Reticulomyxa filosa]|eukprot:ETO20605.1 WD-repeat protein [Reticulomyxa filosa]
MIHLLDCSDTHEYDRWKVYKQVEGSFSGWSIIDVALSNDLKWVCYSGWCNDVALVNIYGDHELHEAHEILAGRGRCCIFGVEFDPLSERLTCASSNGELTIYNIERKQRECSWPNAHGDDVNQSTWLNEHIIVSGSDDGLIKVWDKRIDKHRACVGGFIGHYQGITCVSSCENKYILSNSKDQSMKLWDMRLINSVAECDGIAGELQNLTSQHDYRYRQWRRSAQHNNQKLRLDRSLQTYTGSHQVSTTLIRSDFSLLPPPHTSLFTAAPPTAACASMKL